MGMLVLGSVLTKRIGSEGVGIAMAIVDAVVVGRVVRGGVVGGTEVCGAKGERVVREDILEDGREGDRCALLLRRQRLYLESEAGRLLTQRLRVVVTQTSLVRFAWRRPYLIYALCPSLASRQAMEP